VTSAPVVAKEANTCSEPVIPSQVRHVMLTPCGRHSVLLCINGYYHIKCLQYLTRVLDM